MIKGGYAGKLLEVDLSRRQVRTVPLPEEAVLRQWVGCSGLGLHLLAQELTPKMAASDPETPIFIMTGPLTGTPAPQSSNWTIVTLNAANPRHVSASHSHGYWGARLKHAGWDGIVVRGASATPVYLWVDNDRVEIRDASRLWGQGLFETERRIQLELQDMEQISVACIGPAGENLLLGASVRNDRAFGANKGSPGLVWGAKKLKAIAVRGTGRVPIADYAAFVEVCEPWRKATIESMQSGGRPAGGFAFLIEDAGPNGWIPALNYTSAQWGSQWARRLAEELGKWKVTPLGSYNCEITCHHQTLITTGPFAGTTACGYVSEAIEGAATLIGVEDPGTSLAMNNFYDDMCADPCEPGHAIALAYEMYNKGLLTKEDTGGLDLTWGNYEAAMELFGMMLRREGLGAVLAKGLKEAARELGHGAEEMVVHIQGQGPIDHDYRGRLSRIFAQAISGLGPTLTAGTGLANPDIGTSAVDFGPREEMVPLAGEYTWRTGVKKMWDDSHGTCYFSTMWVPGALGCSAKAVATAVGWQDFGADEAL
ncbi:MAG TPA: aldehyde ferredoxin oxidoreductase N-terminal domain-containing protein, partial [Dehalococcoidia bacterium]|nr:aldehyde ferredoxin oxidoreductase N-terminal domain-containing protein [Dehalococcoidia bacterium]